MQLRDSTILSDTICYVHNNNEFVASMALNSLVGVIEKWLADVLPKANVKVCSADKSEFQNGVSVSFVNFRQSIDVRNTLARRDPVIDQLDVDVLLVPRDGDPMTQATMVADLYFAALQEAPGHLASDEITTSILEKIDLEPGSGLVLTAKLQREREAKKVARVEERVFRVFDKKSSKDTN